MLYKSEGLILGSGKMCERDLEILLPQALDFESDREKVKKG